MAEDKDESQEKSQAPSSRKLEKAAEEGRVVQSKEMYVFTILFAGVFLMYSLPLVVNDFLMSLKSKVKRVFSVDSPNQLLVIQLLLVRIRVR